jgi:hypothetical protein
MEKYLLLHWIWAAVFVGLGVFYAVKPGCLCGMPKFRMPDGADRRRIDAVLSRRKEIERVPRYVGLYLSAASFALAAVAAFTRVEPGLLYGILCLEIATVNAVTYLYLRTVPSKRIAMLAPRTTGSVIPWYWFAVAIAGALAVLTLVSNPSYAISAIVVCVSSLLTIAIAWRLTQLPALLTGDDIETERLVDDRVRAARSSSALTLAVAQPFVLCSQVIDRTTTDAQLAVLFFTLAVFLVYTILSVHKSTAPLPSLTAQ